MPTLTIEYETLEELLIMVEQGLSAAIAVRIALARQEAMDASSADADTPKGGSGEAEDEFEIVYEGLEDGTPTAEWAQVSPKEDQKPEQDT